MKGKDIMFTKDDYKLWLKNKNNIPAITLKKNEIVIKLLFFSLKIKMI